MKNLLKILPIAALLLACSSDGDDYTPEEGSNIVFGANIEGTRAVADINNIKSEGFKVWGGFGSTTVFNGTNITLGSNSTHNTGVAWTFNTYNFYAVYPTTVEATYTAPSTFSINNYSAKENAVTDLMIAQATGHEYPTNGEAVGLFFIHALAKLEFVGKSTNDEQMAFLYSIALYGNGIPAVASYNGNTWTPNSTTSSSAPFISTNNEGQGWRLSKSGNNVLTDLHVFPKNTGQNVTVTLVSNNGNGNVASNVTLPDTKWEAGKIYRYTFSIDPNQYITFSEPEITDWQYGSAGNKVIE